MLYLGVAIAPRLSHGAPAETVAYFGHVARLRRPSRVQQCIEAAADDGLPRMVAQFCATSRIAMAKYQLIRIALLLTMVGAIMVAVSLLGEHGVGCVAPMGGLSSRPTLTADSGSGPSIGPRVR